MTPFKRALLLQAAGAGLLTLSVILASRQPLVAVVAVAGWLVSVWGLYRVNVHLQQRIDRGVLFTQKVHEDLQRLVVKVNQALPGDPATRRATFDAYDRHSYMASIFTEQPNQAVRRDWLRDHSLGRRVLEIGCSTGGIVAYLQELGFDCVGLDISVRALRGGLPGVGYVAGDAYSLPFATAAFDTVALPEVLEHLREPRQALAEAARVAAQRVLVTLPLGPVYDPTHLEIYDRESALALFDGLAGLRVVASAEIEPWIVIAADRVDG